MFLTPLVERNEAFVAAAIDLHREGQIPPNAYVLDLDAICSNTTVICNEAKRHQMSVYAMTKQFGRSPPALAAVAEGGVDGFVCVDMGCLLPIAAAGHNVGHIGHVVQIPGFEVTRALAARPDYWTVYSVEKGLEIARIASERGYVQRLLLRIVGDGDVFYPGQEGGIALDQLPETLEALAATPGVEVSGITTFPAIRYCHDSRKVEPSPNARTLNTAAELLRSAGLQDIQVNAPGNTSATVMPLLASLGATQVEPGHGLTATTPLHIGEDCPERPALLYLTETSHEINGWTYCFGGGLYVDPVFGDYQLEAIVGSTAEEALGHRIRAKLPPIEGIDYYAMLDSSEAGEIKPQQTVIFGFRAQAFVTRAYVVPLSGVSSGHPRPEGVWYTNGLPVSWPAYANDYLA